MALDHGFDQGLSRVARTTGMLDAETEYRLACAWRDRGDKRALDQLVRAYLRLAIAVAGRYRRYGASMGDLVQEASLGLVKAAEKFDPDRGVRFSTYAAWWIKASVQDYVLRNWSLVRTGSTASQKALFFNLARIRARIERDGAGLSAQQVEAEIARTLGVPLGDVHMMTARMTGSDLSLNVSQSQDEDSRDWIDSLPDDGPTGPEIVEERADQARLRHWLGGAMGRLTDRERYILTERQLRDEPRTLESLGAELRLSKERIRQLEAGALAKMRRALGEHEPALRVMMH